VFPCVPGGKEPAITDWEHRAVDVEGLGGAWPKWPANVGIACGPSGLVVIDLDTHGELPPEWQEPGVRDGKDVFAVLCDRAGQPWPVTFWTATPSGGWHMYFTQRAHHTPIRNSAGKLGPMVDARGAGGYVVGPGSVVNGKPYTVMDATPPAPLPDWLFFPLAAGQARTALVPAGQRGGVRSADTTRAGRSTREPPPGHGKGLARAVREAPQGSRQNILHWAAHRVLDFTPPQSQHDAMEELAEAGLAAGLSPRDVQKAIGSAIRSRQ
jgi:hypothetical protein